MNPQTVQTNELPAATFIGSRADGMRGDPKLVTVRTVTDLLVSIESGGIFSMPTSAIDLLEDDEPASTITIAHERGNVTVRYRDGGADFSSVAKNFSDKERLLLERRICDAVEEWPGVDIDFTSTTTTWDDVQGIFDLRELPNTTVQRGNLIEIRLGDIVGLLRQAANFEFVRSGDLQRFILGTLEDFDYDIRELAIR